jgi:hypothetical protein
LELVTVLNIDGERGKRKKKINAEARRDSRKAASWGRLAGLCVSSRSGFCFGALLLHEFAHPFE